VIKVTTVVITVTTTVVMRGVLLAEVVIGIRCGGRAEPSGTGRWVLALLWLLSQ
jgi:uncharacterized membrane protein